MTLDDITAQLLARAQSERGYSSIRTRTALLILDVQNDFTLPSGRLPLTLSADYFDCLRAAVHRTREEGGVVVWVRTESTAPRDQQGEGGWIVLAPEHAGSSPENTTTTATLEERVEDIGADSQDDMDSEDEIVSRAAAASTAHFASSARVQAALQRVTTNYRHVARTGRSTTSSAASPCSGGACTHFNTAADHYLSGHAGPNQPCQPGSSGADSPLVTELSDPDVDLILTKSEYSAFHHSPLLSFLRSRLVTELRVAGCLTNVSIFATCREAVSHGFAIRLLTDCLAYRVRCAHERTMAILTGELGATLAQSTEDELPSASQGDVVTNEANISQLDGAYDHPRESDEYMTAQVLRQSIDGAALDRYFPTTNVHARNGVAYASPRPRSLLPQPVLRTPDSYPSSVASKTTRSRIPVLARTNSRSRLTPSPSPSPSPSSRVRTAWPSANAEPFSSPTSLSASVPTSPPSPAQSRSSSYILSQYLEDSPVASIATDSVDGDQGTAENETESFTESASMDQLNSATSLNSRKETSILENDRESLIRPKPVAAIPPPRLRPKRSFLSTAPILGPDQEMGEGDSRIYYDVPFSLVAATHSVSQGDIFYQIKNEVKWQKMYHVSGEVPRLVCVQGELQADGSMPVYRHPTDQTLPLLRFSSQVQRVKDVVEELVGHPMNHVLIQLYRRGQDYISEHSDKTLDIVRGSAIVNVSFGAMRKMRLRTKKSRHVADAATDASEDNPRQTQQIPMPHSSVFVMGPATNTAWLHGINQDKRAAADRSESERAYDGERISLTFRHIGTFLNHNSTLIWGQGACGKTQSTAHPVINGDETQTNALIRAFGIENQSTTFDWDGVYGDGFDVLHFRDPSAADDMPLLFLSATRAQNLACLIYLHELDEPFHFRVFGAPLEETGASYAPQLSFHDTDAQRTQIDGSTAILLYLDRFYPLAKLGTDAHGATDTSTAQEHRPTGASSFPLLLAYHEWFHEVDEKTALQNKSSHLLHTLAKQLSQENYLSGVAFGVADCAFWPILDEILDDDHLLLEISLRESELEDLREWHTRVEKRAAVHEAVWGDAVE